MKRTIACTIRMMVARRMLGFEPDAEGAWVVRLDCGHRRHVRHRPPASSYPWVLEPAGRAARIGETIECPRCARLELPAGAEVYRTTAIFDAATVPAGLLAEHRIRAGSWGRLVVLDGALELHLGAPFERVYAVVAGQPATIPPEIPHHVVLDPTTAPRFRVEFLRAP